MNDLIRQGRRRGARAGRARSLVEVAMLLSMLLPPPAAAGDRAPMYARAGLDIASSAARMWSPDAYLIYVENDERLDSHGAALRWGYLFHSPALKKSRVYSVRDGKIVVAEELGMRFEAPPIAGDWIDSGAAIRIADDGVAYRFRFDHDGRLDTMMLLRGAIQEDRPDRTTWMLVYTAPNVPSLFVVLDAADGKVLRLWRG